MKFTANQKKLLNMLLDKYERSKTYQGTNLLQQSFAADPVAVWSEYASDFANMEQVRDFENEMQYLQDIGLVTVQKKNGVITKILACNEKLTDYYIIVQRKAKADIVQEQITFFRQWKEKNIFLITSFCDEQLARISAGKKPAYDIEMSEKLLQILEFIQNNPEELLERELSILLFADSKAFEDKYRSKICKIIQTYQDFSEKLTGIDDAREQEKAILEEFNIYANPSYIYLKGKMVLILDEGREFRMDSAPLAISSDLLKKVTSITVETDKIVTVENLTSFHRVCEGDCVYIYVAGYHNSAKQALLKRIDRENPEKKWFHFGDIDPDGFYILEHLRKGTGIDFWPLFMSVRELEQFGAYCKRLSQKDRVKAENLVTSGKYAETLQYMLEKNCKLEQEIVSMSFS